MGYRIAGRVNPRVDLTAVSGQSQFARAIGQLFEAERPRRLIETGTYLGLGSTSVLARALKDAEVTDATFYSIEVNPDHYRRAVINLSRQGLNVSTLNGLSVPRSLLPTREQIERDYVLGPTEDDVYIDHEEPQRAELYHRETDYPDLADDLLGRCLKRFDYRPDFVLLDSAGHLGHVEYQYVLRLLAGPCYVALDDIYHVKHFRSFQEMRADPRFELVSVSEEKFGFCIGRFTPNV